MVNKILEQSNLSQSGLLGNVLTVYSPIPRRGSVVIYHVLRLSDAASTTDRQQLQCRISEQIIEAGGLISAELEGFPDPEIGE